MSHVRTLDHVAVAVSDTERRLQHFSGRLGLAVVRGEGLHHICFGVDDVPGPRPHSVAVECTEFHFEEDVDGRGGWLHNQ